MYALDSFNFTRKSRDYIARIYSDDTSDAPWDREDGHGPVRSAPHRYGHQRKSPGEVIIKASRDGVFFYDFAGACRMARADGWGCKGGRKEGETARQYAARAAFSDMERMRHFLADHWSYVGVSVSPMDDEGEPGKETYRFAIWGIESDCVEYIKETARELADECAAELSRSVYAGATVGEA